MRLACERLDPYRHDMGKVAGLVYDVDPFLTRLEFGSRPAGIRRIRRLIEADADPFRPGYGLVAVDETAVAGVAFGVSAKELASTPKTGAGVLYGCVGPTGMVRLAIAGAFTHRLLTRQFDAADYYVLILSVDPARQGHGAGSFLLENIVETAHEKGCHRVILDVSVENENALTFYERRGFTRAKQNRLVPLWDRVGTYTMMRAI